MIARGFKPVVWVAAVGAAALGCYMLSLRVASERADLTSLQQRIVETRQQIRALQTEVGTRGRLAQLEQWNTEVLALAPPASGQFVQGAQLARFETRDTSPLDGQADVQMASAETPSAPPPPIAAPAAPVAQRAIAGAPAVAAPAPLRQATVQRTSMAMNSQPTTPRVLVQPPEPRLAAASAPARTPVRTGARTAPVRGAAAPVAQVPARTAAPVRARTAAAPVAQAPARSTAPVRARTAAAAPVVRPPARAAAPARTRTASAEPASPPARRSSLLDDRTLRDIGTAARAERGGGTRN